MTEREIKLERVRGFIEARRLAGVLLATTANFTWLAGGASHTNGLASEGRPPEATGGTASLLVTPDACVLIASTLEMPRLEAEELPDAGMAVESFPWDVPDLSGIVWRHAGHGTIAADFPLAGTEALDHEFAALRYALLPEERERYRRLGEEVGLCVSRACFEARPGLSEQRIAGMLAGDLLSFGIEPTLLLVGADSRARDFHHPIPTDRRLEEYLRIRVGARRAGLMASIARAVHFGPIPGELRRCHDATCRVDAVLHRATRPGADVGTIWVAGAAASAEAGFPQEWRRYPQGGATGYTHRDYQATAESREIVQANQAFAWNPSITGTHSEDTLLATPDGPEILTVTPDLPLARVTLDAGIVMERPDILCR
jgi:Xaa-Pro aminopeptidase